tara:strand:- start:11087 stop:12013 length:927 start_codon:yes stop_codon:yes gene_type:complete
MGFFNKKEEVLDFVLTEYGKYSLAIGKLDPAYYAFFDDDILYDVAASGYVENQNQSEGRIQEETPKLKIIPTRTGAETRVTKFLNNLQTAIGNTNSDPAENVEAFKQPVFAETGKIDAYPLGNASLLSQYSAAWQLQLLSQPEISSSVSYLDEDGYINNIPQLNITVDYEVYFKAGDPQLSPISISERIGNTDIFLALNEKYLMMEINENNTDFLKENFDIQVFHSSSTGYIQKAYTPEDVQTFAASTTDNVEYYMNVLVDKEIPPEVIEELNISEKALSTSASRLKLNRDLYSAGTGAPGDENEEPC